LATVQKFGNANAASTGAGFTNPTNAYADDGSYATCAPAKNGGIGSDYGFPAFASQDIPDGATINSVAVEIQYKSSTTGSANASMRLQLENGTLLDAEQSGGMSTTDTTLTHSVASGIALDDLRNANGVQARVTGRRGNSNTAITWSVDYVRLTVDYTPAVVGAGSAGLTLGASGAGVVEDAALGEIAGSGSAVLTLSASGAATLPIAGSGSVALGVGASGSGALAVGGAGALGFALAAVGTGTLPVVGAGAMLLTLIATGDGSGPGEAVAGAGSAALMLGATGLGMIRVGGDGAALLGVGVTAAGVVPIVGAAALTLGLGASGEGGSPVTLGAGLVAFVLQVAAAGDVTGAVLVASPVTSWPAGRMAAALDTPATTRRSGVSVAWRG
jgi:hypothetical protein